MDNNFTPINLAPDFEAKVQQFTELMQTPEMINYTANKAEEQIFGNLSEPLIDIPFRNPNKKMESLLEEQLKQYETANKDLHKQLEEAQLQLKQLNDKESSRNFYIKELKADLQMESLKRELAENKLSSKDWKTIVISFLTAIVILVIEHWKDVLSFILHLIELQ